MSGKKEESETTRVPVSILKKADRISERAGVPRTQALKILYETSNSYQTSKVVERVENELYKNLILEFTEKQIEKIINSFHLPVILKFIGEVNGSERDERIEILEKKSINKLQEFLNEVKKYDNEEEKEEKRE